MRGFIRAFLACALSAAVFAPSASAQTDLANATATLLPDENILIAGGSSTVTGAAATLTLADMANGTYLSMPNFPSSVARTSHTATLLPNGDVLFAGGFNNSGAVNSVDIFNPVGRCWYPTLSMTGTSGGTGRFNHTATLLQNGNVLICGGQDSSPSPQYWPNCDVFIPASPLPLPANDLTCAQTIGSMLSAANVVPMTVARSGHTATLLSDGRVFIAGGYNPTDGYLPTTEIYNPANGSYGSFSAGTPLNVERAFHAATLMGDNKVLITGGISYESSVSAGPGGFLSGGEIYDPVSNSITLSTPTAERLAYHTSTLKADGEVFLYGGLGNIATSYISTSGSLQSGSSITFNSPCSGSCGSYALNPNPDPVPLQSYNLNFSNLSFTLGVPVSGIIVDGYVLFSSASVSLSSGTAVFGFQGTNPAGTDGGQGTGCGSLEGAAICLAGVQVTCQWSGQTATCGQINLQNVNLSAFSNTTSCAGGACGTMEVSTVSVSSVIDLTGQSYSVQIATVVINKMVFGTRELYNPSSNLWTFANPINGLPTNPPVFSHGAVLRPNDTVAIFGGLTCSAASPETPPCTYVDQSSDTLNIPSDFGQWKNAGALSTSRADHTSTLLSTGTILIAGGENVSGFLNSAEILDPASNSIAATGSMNYPRSLHTAALLVNGNVLVAGGQTAIGGSTQTTATAEVYYPATAAGSQSIGGSWGMTGSMNQARQNHSMILLADGRVLVAGGDQLNGTYLYSAEVYSSTTGIWSTTGAMNYSRANLSLTLLRDGTVLAVGGVNTSGALGYAEIYNPALGSWSATDPLPGNLKLYNHRATLLYDGRVLISGGNNGGGQTGSSYIYDPTQPSGSHWVKAGSLVYPRYNHTAVAFPDGDVWVIGGSQVVDITNTVERFDTWLQTWTTSTFNMSQARTNQTSILAPNGYVYVIGGSGGGSNYLNSVESAYFSGFPDATTPGSPPSLRQPTVTASDATPFYPGNSFTVTGTNFQGMTEASGGGGAGSNSFFYGPRLVLESLGGAGGTGSQGSSDFTIDLSTELYYGPNATAPWSLSASSLSAVMGAPYSSTVSGVLPMGWYQLRVGANAQFSTGYIVQAGPSKPAAAPTNIAGSTLTATAIQWTWSPVGAPIDGYDIYDSSTGVWLATAPVSGTPSYLQTNAFPGQANAVWIAAYTLSGDGPLALAPSVVTPTTTFSCNALPGEVCGVILPQETSNFTGTLGNGRFVQLTAPAGAFSTSYSSIDVVASVPASFPCVHGTSVAVALATSYPSTNIQPTGSLQIVLGYLAGDLQGPANEYLLMRVDSANQCHPVPTSINTSESVITASIDQLATYQLAQVTPASTLGPVQIYPNPFYPARAPAMTFANLPSDARLRLFTVRGELVLDVNAGATGTYLWNGSNKAGRAVASGLYLAVIESNGSKQVHKVVILR